MFDPLSITGVPYDCNQFVNQLQAYNTWENNDEMLELYRFIQKSGNYYWQGACFPDSTYFPTSVSPTNGVNPGETVNGTIVVPPGTYVTSMTAFSGNSDGFRIKLYDKGTKVSIFYGDYSKQNPVAGNMGIDPIYSYSPSDPGSNVDTPIGPNLLLSPFIVTGPGVLGWEVVNDSGSVNIIQVLLGLAVPVTARSILQVIVNRSRPI